MTHLPTSLLEVIRWCLITSTVLLAVLVLAVLCGLWLARKVWTELFRRRMW